MKYFSYDYERWLDSSIYLRKEIKKLLDSHYLDSQQKGIENQNKTITCFDQNYFIQKNEEEENRYFVLKNKTQLTQLSAKIEILERFKSLLFDF